MAMNERGAARGHVATVAYVMCFMYVMYVDFFDDSPARGRTVGVRWRVVGDVGPPHLANTP
ncbi:hypothetical protein DS079_06520 [Brachybacterium paraconglomeratum]|uniref:Uncharacterized protein n=1 Tax=Brachybacterium paraconglomeratum TaxID=173362 RepID=A0A3R8RZF7_9MICO|nr:hypothetical protein DS079_06520 [Brachybacterium paraconglomeratum]